MAFKTEKFNSRIGLLLALVGSAVGLGNMWRFPYLLGSNGGAAFLLFYLVFVFILCLPIYLSEVYAGRKTRQNAFMAFNQISGNRTGRAMGGFFMISVFCTISFYIVVGGWIISYFVGSLRFNSLLSPESIDSFGTVVMGMENTPASTLICLGCTILFMVMTAAIINMGVVNGIERFSKITMPLLFFLILGIAVYSLTMPGSLEGVRYLFKPDFSKVNGSMLANALGQAFMSLSLGCGTVLTYSSYSHDKTNSVNLAVWTIILDTLFALISGLAIIPAVFAFGMAPGQGPELVFNTLPRVFSSMPGGQIIAIIFFFTLFIAAISSSISLMEPLVASLVSDKFSRTKAVIVVTVGVCLAGALCSLSFGPLSGVKVPGGTIFDMFNIAASNVFMVLGALGTVVLVGWFASKEDFAAVLSSEDGKYTRLLYILHFMVKWVAPAAILFIMVLGFINI